MIPFVIDNQENRLSDALNELLAQSVGKPVDVAVLVEDAYALTPEERRLLHDTRPIRDPIDVLKARIAGKRIVAPEHITKDN